MNFSEYTVTIGTDPEYYGSECTEAEAAEIVKKLAALVAGKFPGINIEFDPYARRFSGPDEGTVDEIIDWIRDNWTAAL